MRGTKRRGLTVKEYKKIVSSGYGGISEKTKFIIGIDPGIKNGFAVKGVTSGELLQVASYPLHGLLAILKHYGGIAEGFDNLLVKIENPNTWVGFKGISREEANLRRAGAGAVKQTYKHIIEYLEFEGIPYQNIKLQGKLKKLKSDKFKEISGWTQATNEHGRDAAMMIL